MPGGYGPLSLDRLHPYKYDRRFMTVCRKSERTIDKQSGGKPINTIG